MRRLETYKLFEKNLQTRTMEDVDEEELQELKESLMNMVNLECDQELTKMFIDKGYDIDYCDLDNVTGDPHYFKWLLENGKDISNLNVHLFAVKRGYEIQKAIFDTGNGAWYMETGAHIMEEIKEDPEYDYLFDSEELGLL